jgi:hypothetical protein
MLSTRIKPKIKYDAEYDVLYLTLGNTANSYGDEEPDNIITLRDFDTDDVTGYTIMNFKRICENGSEEYQLLQSLFDVREVRTICGF